MRQLIAAPCTSLYQEAPVIHGTHLRPVFCSFVKPPGCDFTAGSQRAGRERSIATWGSYCSRTSRHNVRTIAHKGETLPVKLHIYDQPWATTSASRRKSSRPGSNVNRVSIILSDMAFITGLCIRVLTSSFLLFSAVIILFIHVFIIFFLS